MADTPEQVVLPEGTVQQEPVKVPEPSVELTPLEQEMTQFGWKPKDQWEGEPEEWRSAREFKERGEWIKQKTDLRRQLERTQTALHALQQHHKSVFEQAHAKAVSDLKEAHKLAVQEGDVDAAVEIADQIEEEHKKLAEAQAQQIPVAPPVPVEIDDFKERNASWYEKDDVMTAYADRIGHEYARSQMAQGLRPQLSEILTTVEKKVREKFPSAFGVKRAATNPVGPSASPARPAKTQGSGITEADLDANELKVMRSLVENKVLTKEQYLSDLAKVKGIK